MSDMRGDKGPATAVATDALPREFSKRSEFKPKSRRSFHLLTSGTGTGRLRRLTAGVVLAGVTAGALGWFLSSAARNGVIGLIGQNTERTDQPTEMKSSFPRIRKMFPLSDQRISARKGLCPILHLPTVAQPTLNAPGGRASARHAMERPAARPTANGSVRRTEDPVLKSKSAKLSERTTVGVKDPPVENARSQAVKSLPARPMENTAAQQRAVHE